VEDHSGTVIAGGGVVAVVGGTFMLVGVTEASQTHRMWTNLWFAFGLALAVLGIIAVVVGTYLHFRQPGGPSPATLAAAAADPEPEDGATTSTGVRGPTAEVAALPSGPVLSSDALELRLEDERWDIWQGAALLAALKIRITAKRPIRLVHFDLESDDPGLEAGRPRLNQAQVDTLFNDMLQRRDGYGSSQLRSGDMLPGDSMSGWWVQWAYLPFPERAGHPRCVFKVWDGGGDVYELEIPPRGPQIHRASG